MDDRLWSNMHRITARRRDALKPLLTERGLSMGMNHVLVYLSAHGQCPQGDVVLQRDMDKATASRLVRSLCEQGLVTAAPDPADRRQMLLRITPAGEALLQELSPRIEAVDGALLSALSAEEQATLTELLSRVEKNSLAL